MEPSIEDLLTDLFMSNGRNIASHTDRPTDHVQIATCFSAYACGFQTALEIAAVDPSVGLSVIRHIHQKLATFDPANVAEFNSHALLFIRRLRQTDHDVSSN